MQSTSISIKLFSMFEIVFAPLRSDGADDDDAEIPDLRS
jgi:hypothetical protein